MKNKLVPSGAAAVVAAVLLLAGGAAADPTNAPRAFGPLDLVCDDGRTYSVVVNGNGAFTPGHDVASTSTLVPVAFGEFTGTVRDPEGNVVDTFTDPPASKGQSAKNAKGLVNCSFSFTETSDGSDPGFPAGYTATGEGTVVVRVTPSGP